MPVECPVCESPDGVISEAKALLLGHCMHCGANLDEI